MTERNATRRPHEHEVFTLKKSRRATCLYIWFVCYTNDISKPQSVYDPIYLKIFTLRELDVRSTGHCSSIFAPKRNQFGVRDSFSLSIPSLLHTVCLFCLSSFWIWFTAICYFIVETWNHVNENPHELGAHWGTTQCSKHQCSCIQ